HALFPHMTVYDNIAVGPRIRRMEEREIARRVGELLEITRMGHRRDARPLQLSGGESQRVALARALINRPKLLLLDEPLSALDETLRQSLREELADMQQALGTTFLFVTHDREEAMSLAHRMGVLHEGRTLQTGTPEDLYDRPDHPFVARFLGEVNRLPGVIAEAGAGRVRITLDWGPQIEGRTPTAFAAGARVTVYARPEKMTLVAVEEDPAPTLNGVVRSRAFLGSRARYRVRLKGGPEVQVLAPAAGTARAWPPGAAVRVRLAADDLMVFPEAAA
ncbi:MAG: ABC transporter ATP-binding protein, partial [Nitrospinaceae bacterium]